MSDQLAEPYFVTFAAAFVRGKRPDAPDLAPDSLVQWGKQQGLRLQKFKRTPTLPRVRAILGILHSIAPDDLIDVGSGRGVFLWPLLEAFPDLALTTIDSNPQRASDLAALQRGGLERLTALHADAETVGLPENCTDVVTLLEVLEHMDNPQRATQNAIRWAKRAVLASVPSKEDNNPEHRHLFSKGDLESLFESAGAVSVRIQHVLNHRIAIAKVPT